MLSQVWLVHLINGLVPEGAGLKKPEGPLDSWLRHQWVTRGYAAGVPKTFPVSVFQALGQIPAHLLPLVRHVGHQIQLADQILREDREHVELEHSVLILAVIALSYRLEEDGFDLLQASRCQQRSWNASLNEIAARVGHRILTGKISGEDKIAGLPFHHLCLLSELKLTASISSLVLNSGDESIDVRQLHRVEGLSREIVHRGLSASIALVAIDGEIDRDENRVIQLLMASAHLDDAEKRMFSAELRQPDDVIELTRGQNCPLEASLLVKHLFVVSYLNGSHDVDEQTFIRCLSDALGLDGNEHLNLELEAIELLRSGTISLNPSRPELLWEKVRRRMVRRVERLIRMHADSIWKEVKETGELLTLLSRSTQTPLTEAEKERVREQLIDIAKSIPALAIFAAPGGGLLLPILIKHLPIDLRPSNFVEQAEFIVEQPTETES